MKIPTIGAQAPDFSLTLDTGETFKLSEKRGQAVVLFFYPKDGTPGCTIENQDFSANLAAFSSANTLVVGISADDTASHCAFREKYDLDVPLIADPEHIAISAYGVWAEKSNFGKKYMGLVRSTFLINSEGKIADYWKVSRVKGHVDKVLEASTAL